MKQVQQNIVSGQQLNIEESSTNKNAPPRPPPPSNFTKNTAIAPQAPYQNWNSYGGNVF